MTTHELKLDVAFFNDVKGGKKPFEVRRNDRDFNRNDTLILTKSKNGTVLANNPEQLKAKVLTVYPAEQINLALEKIKGGAYAGTMPAIIFLKQILEVLEEFFGETTVPDDYVVMGIDLIK